MFEIGQRGHGGANDVVIWKVRTNRAAGANGPAAIRGACYWGTVNFLRAAGGAEIDCAAPSGDGDAEDDEASSEPRYFGSAT